MKQFDLIVKNGSVVMPGIGVVEADIGITNDKITSIACGLEDNGRADRVIDASGKHVFPGAIDSHFHVGIYRPVKEDAESESRSAASGGVTTLLSYFRTGGSYLNKQGPYKEILPELLELSADAFFVDYGYHLALFTEEHLDEIEWLISEGGVSTFKYYMFYKLLNLAGASSTGASYLMIDNPIDFGFLYRFMRQVGKANSQFKNYGNISLSVHCENPEIIRATQEEVKRNPSGNPMKDYSDARPTWQEALAIHEVAVIARQVGCPLNLLHLSSMDAIEAGKTVASLFPDHPFLLEGTLHHLGLHYEMGLDRYAKVNPPLRSRKDVDHLWSSLIDHTIDTVVSDHACNPKENKKGDLWTSLPGFGGTSLMFPLLITEGYHRRGLPLARIAELTSSNPARYHNLFPKKGALAPGCDADLAIIDLNKEKTVTIENLFSAQDYSPEEGMKLKGWPDLTILRGRVIYENETVTGEAGYGQFIKRPVRLHYGV